MTPLQHMYHSVLTSSAHMVAAAEQADWSRVAELQALCLERRAHIQAHEKAHPLTPAQRRSKHAALLALLRHDAQIRALAEPGWERAHLALAPRH